MTASVICLGVSQLSPPGKKSKQPSARGLSSTLSCCPASFEWSPCSQMNSLRNVTTDSPFFGCRILSKRKSGCLESCHLILCQGPGEFSFLIFWEWPNHFWITQSTWWAWLTCLTFPRTNLHCSTTTGCANTGRMSAKIWQKEDVKFPAQLRKLVLVTLINWDWLDQWEWPDLALVWNNLLASLTNGISTKQTQDNAPFASGVSVDHSDFIHLVTWCCLWHSLTESTVVHYSDNSPLHPSLWKVLRMLQDSPGIHTKSLAFNGNCCTVELSKSDNSYNWNGMLLFFSQFSILVRHISICYLLKFFIRFSCILHSSLHIIFLLNNWKHLEQTTSFSMYSEEPNDFEKLSKQGQSFKISM